MQARDFGEIIPRRSIELSLVQLRTSGIYQSAGAQNFWPGSQTLCALLAVLFFVGVGVTVIVQPFVGV